MSIKFFTEADVADCLTMPIAVTALEEAFRRWHAGEAMNVPRRRAQGKHLVLHTMSAVADYLNLGGWKSYSTTREGAIFHVGLYNATSGHPVALIEADRLGQLRTGAATGVAIKHLTPDAPITLGLIGAGWQAESQLQAAASVRQLSAVSVYSRDTQRREKFAQRMSEQLRLNVVAAATASDAVAGKSVVITATTSRTPVFEADSINDSALVCAVGSNWLHKAEVPAELFARLRTVVCDSVEACQLEAGDLHAALTKGVFHWNTAQELLGIVSGEQPSRERTGPVLFKSVGLTLEDVALGAELLKIAATRGIGRTLPA